MTFNLQEFSVDDIQQDPLSQGILSRLYTVAQASKGITGNAAALIPDVMASFQDMRQALELGTAYTAVGDRAVKHARLYMADAIAFIATQTYRQVTTETNSLPIMTDDGSLEVSKVSQAVQQALFHTYSAEERKQGTLLGAKLESQPSYLIWLLDKKFAEFQGGNLDHQISTFINRAAGQDQGLNDAMWYKFEDLYSAVVQLFPAEFIPKEYQGIRIASSQNVNIPRRSTADGNLDGSADAVSCCCWCGSNSQGPDETTALIGSGSGSSSSSRRRFCGSGKCFMLTFAVLVVMGLFGVGSYFPYRALRDAQDAQAASASFGATPDSLGSILKHNPKAAFSEFNKSKGEFTLLWWLMTNDIAIGLVVLALVFYSIIKLCKRRRTSTQYHELHATFSDA